MKNYTRKLWSYLGPCLCVLFLFGTAGNVKANSKAKSDNLDGIFLYKTKVLERNNLVESGSERAFAEAAMSPEDYIYSGDMPVRIHSTSGEELQGECSETWEEKILSLDSDEERKAFLEENFLYYRGKIKKVKDCIIYFKAENGKRYEIPFSDVANLELGDPTSELYDVLLNMGTQTSACTQGWNDASNNHSDIGWFFGGAVFGPLTVLFAALSNPTPGYSVSDYDYIRCYTNKARSMNISSAIWGALVEMGLVTVVVVW
jgi:hypothetical protein